MTALRTISSYLVVITMLIGFSAAGALAADAVKKPAPGSAGEFVASWAEAIELGHAAKAASMVDQSTPVGKEYAAYVGEVAAVRNERLDIVARVRKAFGEATAAKADKMISSTASGVLESGYGFSADALLEMKEGSKFYPPGAKTECVVIKKDGKWLIDGSQVGAASVPHEFESYRDKLTTASKLTDSAKSGDELLKAIAKAYGLPEVP